MLTREPAQAQATIVVVGVDTHKDTHHGAVLDLNGQVLGDQEFPVTTAGYRQLLDWAAGFGVVDKFGIELTGSYGAGLTRFLTGAGVTVLEVNSTDRATRARLGKDDRIDAISAAQKVLSGMATALPKDTTAVTEAIRVLKLARDSAVKSRTIAVNQLKDLRVTAPAELRESLDGLTLPQLANKAAAFRPDQPRIAEPVQAVKTAMKRLAERVLALDVEIKDGEKDIVVLVEATAPTLLARPGIGPHTAAQFLITIGPNINRIRSDAAFARICGAAPVPVSSGKTNRMRLHKGGDRQANSALHLIIIGRFKNHAPTQAYRDKKLAQGHSKRDVIRALKRYVAREIFKILKTDLNQA